MNASTAIIPETTSIFDVLNQLTTLQKQAIVRPTNPPPGLAGFLFDVPEDDEINRRAEITNHFVENNTVVVDQIALLPREYTVKGLVAEIVAVPPAPDVVARVANPLPDNPDLDPELAPQAAQEADAAAATAASSNAALEQSSSLWGYFLDQGPKPPNQTRQTRAYLYFDQLMSARELFTVETPWGFLTDMAILTYRVAQGDETKWQSTFSITFKQIQTAGGATIAAGKLAGRANLQMAPVSNNGTAGQAPLSSTQRQSLLSRLANGP